MTQVATTGASVTTTLSTFDANGNVTTVLSSGGAFTSTTTYTNTATAQVCK
jgi:hypothetical protein